MKRKTNKFIKKAKKAIKQFSPNTNMDFNISISNGKVAVSGFID